MRERKRREKSAEKGREDKQEGGKEEGRGKEKWYFEKRNPSATCKILNYEKEIEQTQYDENLPS